MTVWLGHPTIELDTVASTNDEAVARARAGAGHGTVIVAAAQTRGRGRQGRAWHSPPNQNLYLSMILRLSSAPAAAPPLTLACGVAVCDALALFGVRPSLKWPNDVLIDGRKVAGILTESSTRGDALESAVVGIGVNVDATEFPADLEASATSLRLSGAAASLGAVRLAILDEVERWVDRFVAGGVAPIAAAWTERAAPGQVLAL